MFFGSRRDDLVNFKSSSLAQQRHKINGISRGLQLVAGTLEAERQRSEISDHNKTKNYYHFRRSLFGLRTCLESGTSEQWIYTILSVSKEIKEYMNHEHLLEVIFRNGTSRENKRYVSTAEPVIFSTARCVVFGTSCSEFLQIQSWKNSQRISYRWPSKGMILFRVTPDND